MINLFRRSFGLVARKNAALSYWLFKNFWLPGLAIGAFIIGLQILTGIALIFWSVEVAFQSSYPISILYMILMAIIVFFNILLQPPLQYVGVIIAMTGSEAVWKITGLTRVMNISEAHYLTWLINITKSGENHDR